jgi:hypothetical protein
MKSRGKFWVVVNLFVIAAASVALQPREVQASSAVDEACENYECQGVDTCRAYDGYECWRNASHTECMNKKCAAS